jgi:dipeptidyl aminopeptidase/acylaminoacyl peptidase
MVNYRVSTGYGRTWRDAIIGSIGFLKVQDTVAGLDHLIEVLREQSPFFSKRAARRLARTEHP